jgi:hypothetical protein
MYVLPALIAATTVFTVASKYYRTKVTTTLVTEVLLRFKFDERLATGKIAPMLACLSHPEIFSSIRLA